jgi:UDP-glucuronate 4-epimerase
MAETTGRLGCRPGDIQDLALLQGLFQEQLVDLVIHLAAMAGVRPSIECPLTYSEVNIHGTLNLLKCCRTDDLSHLLFGSSSSVYGARQRVPLTEDGNVSTPVSPHATTKCDGGLLCYTYAHLYRLRVA